MLWFLLLFVGAPLIELYFLIQVGSVIGALPTILLTLLTALVGGALVRIQGVGVLMRVRAMMERGEVPALEVLDGAALLLAGFALLLPGFITDAIGFLLLIPPLRRALILRFVRVEAMGSSSSPFGRDPRAQGARIIEGDYVREVHAEGRAEVQEEDKAADERSRDQSSKDTKDPHH